HEEPRWWFGCSGRGNYNKLADMPLPKRNMITALTAVGAEVDRSPSTARLCESAQMSYLARGSRPPMRNVPAARPCRSTVSIAHRPVRAAVKVGIAANVCLCCPVLLPCQCCGLRITRYRVLQHFLMLTVFSGTKHPTLFGYGSAFENSVGTRASPRSTLSFCAFSTTRACALHYLPNGIVGAREQIVFEGVVHKHFSPHVVGFLIVLFTFSLSISLPCRCLVRYDGKLSP
ncbi:unnamed protein product, partial [Ectocarpus sp. 12 AP-2014]